MYLLTLTTGDPDTSSSVTYNKGKEDNNRGNFLALGSWCSLSITERRNKRVSNSNETLCVTGDSTTVITVVRNKRKKVVP